MDNEYLEEKKKIKSNIFGGLFIAWFIMSIVGMIFLKDTLYCVMLFGQYFLIFGLIPLIKAEKFEKLISIPFLATGICCIVIPFFVMNPQLLPKEINWDYVIVILLLLAFVLAGCCAAFIPLYNRKRLKMICNYSVIAKIVEYDISKSDKGNTLYCPIYGFWYNGQDRKVSNNYYTNIGVKEIGTECELMINPENPEEFYIENSKAYLIPVVIGILVVAFVLPLLIYVINNGI